MNELESIRIEHIKLFELQETIECRIIKRNKNMWGILRGFKVGQPKTTENNSFEIIESNEIVAQGEIMPIKFKNGSVRYREDLKLYEYRYRLEHKTKSLYAKTQVELKRKYEELQKKLLEHLNKPKIEPPKLTFEDWLKVWYETYKIPKLEESSLYQIRNVIKNHIPDKIKKSSIDKLDVLEIQKSLNENPSTRMAKYTFNIYTDSLSWAYKLGKIQKDISKMLLPITHISEEGTALSLKQRQDIEKISWNNPEFYIFIFYLYTGCRPSEALTVAWSDVDYENGTLHIHGTKTNTSDRTIPLFAPIRDLLAKMESTDGYIFDYKYKALNNRRKKLIKIVGFEFETKDLRTTFATFLEEQKVPKSLIKRWMGHTSEKTTNNYYIKILPDFEKSEVNKLELKFTQNTTQNDIKKSTKKMQDT